MAGEPPGSEAAAPRHPEQAQGGQGPEDRAEDRREHVDCRRGRGPAHRPVTFPATGAGGPPP